MEKSATLERNSKVIFCKVSYSGMHSKVTYISNASESPHDELVSMKKMLFLESLPLWSCIQSHRQALNIGRYLNYFTALQVSLLFQHAEIDLRESWSFLSTHFLRIT